MADVAPLKATFFALTKRDRAVLLPATIAIVTLIALLFGAFIATNWRTIVELVELIGQSGERPSEEAGLQLAGRLFSVFGTAFLFLFPLYFAVASYEAGCLRWMIHGEAPGLFGLTLGRDMWRVYGVYWCWFLTHIALSVASALVMAPIMIMTIGSVATSGSPEGMLHRQMMVQLPLTLLQYCALIFVGVRLAPAAATAIAYKQFVFFRAWQVTQGRFWTLLGSFALVWVGASLLSIFVVVAICAGVFGSVMIQSPRMDPAAFLTPTNIAIAAVGYAICLVISFGAVVMGYGINARAARAALEEGKVEDDALMPPSSVGM